LAAKRRKRLKKNPQNVVMDHGNHICLSFLRFFHFFAAILSDLIYTIGEVSL